MSRKSKVHAADKFCRAVIDQYPNSREVADMFYRDRTITTGECPDWCALPSSYMACFIAGSTDKQDIINVHNQKAVYFLTAALIWSRSKMIYRFDNTLSDTLTVQSLEGKIPVDILDYLPYQCIYIDNDIIVGGSKTMGFFACLIGGQRTILSCFVWFF